MAEGGESGSRNNLEDLSVKLKRTATNANMLKDEFSNVCYEIKATHSEFTDEAMRNVLNESGKIIKASDEILKNAKDIHKFVSTSQESRQENVMRHVSGRKQPLQRDSGIGRSVDSSVLQQENSLITNPVGDREECNYSVQETNYDSN